MSEFEVPEAIICSPFVRSDRHFHEVDSVSHRLACKV
jgi:hypothetical protein